MEPKQLECTKVARLVRPACDERLELWYLDTLQFRFRIDSHYHHVIFDAQIIPIPL
jgi:hypothetical protein